MIVPRKLAILPTLFILLQAHPAIAARTWDLIYTDRVNVTLCNGCHITLAHDSFGLLVNTGDTSLEAEDLLGTTFEVESSVPEIRFHAFLYSANFPAILPIAPGEAVGSITWGNSVLATLVQPGETYRNTSPLVFLSFQIDRDSGVTYEGPVSFDVKLRMAQRIARFTIEADVKLGRPAISFPSAARAFRTTAALEASTPVRPSTWGSIKQLYR